MAFSRVVNLSIGTNGQGLVISDLDIEFEISRSITFSENSATFRVFNAQQNTRSEILKIGNNVIFDAGYEDDGVGTLFIGNIVQSQSYLTGSDWVTDILAVCDRAEDQPLDSVNLTLSYKKDVPLSSIISDIADSLGLAIFGAENAQMKLPNGFTYTGNVRKALKMCDKILKDNNSYLYRDNSVIVIINRDRPTDFTTVYMDYDSGLLSVKDITESEALMNAKELKKAQKEGTKKRVAFSTILVPKMRPNGLITFKNTGNDGTFVIEKVTFKGDNFGGDFNCEGEAVVY
jgi:hypothetical protein